MFILFASSAYKVVTKFECLMPMLLIDGRLFDYQLNLVVIAHRVVSCKQTDDTKIQHGMLYFVCSLSQSASLLPSRSLLCKVRISDFLAVLLLDLLDATLCIHHCRDAYFVL
jgi:hypothetical protein